MADKTTTLAIVITAKNQASGIINQIKGDVSSAASSMAGPLRGLQGAFGLVGGAVSAVIAPVRAAAAALLNFAKNVAERVISKLKTMIKWIVALGLALAEEVARRSVNAFADYEQAVTNAMTVTGLLGDALDKAKKTVFDFGLELSRTSSKMPTEIAGAFYSLSSAGLDVNETMAAAPGVLALAEGTMAEMGQTTELTTVAMKAFQLGSSGVNRIVNASAAIIGASRMNMERLSASFPYAATAAKAFNISLEQMLATLGIAVDRGLAATMAGTGFRMMLAKSVDVTDKGAEVLAQYGLRASDVNMQLHGMVPVLDLLKRTQMSYGDVVKLFGVRAANMVFILKDNVAGLLQLQQRITGTNMAFQMQQQQLNTVKRSWDVLKSTLQEMQIRFARALTPAIRIVIRYLQQFAEALLGLNYAEKAGRWVGQLMVRVLGLIHALIWSKDVRSIIYNIGSAFRAVYETFIGTWGAGRFEDVILGVVHKVAEVIYWLVQNVFNPTRLGAVKKWVMGIFDTVMGGLKRLYEGIRGSLMNIKSLLPGLLGGLWSWLKGEGQFPVQITRDIATEILRIISWLGQQLVIYVDNLLYDAFGVRWEQAKQTVIKFAQDVYASLLELKPVFDVVGAAVKTVYDILIAMANHPFWKKVLFWGVIFGIFAKALYAPFMAVYGLIQILKLLGIVKLAAWAWSGARAMWGLAAGLLGVRDAAVAARSAQLLLPGMRGGAAAAGAARGAGGVVAGGGAAAAGLWGTVIAGVGATIWEGVTQGLRSYRAKESVGTRMLRGAPMAIPGIATVMGVGRGVSRVAGYKGLMPWESPIGGGTRAGGNRVEEINVYVGNEPVDARIRRTVRSASY